LREHIECIGKDNFIFIDYKMLLQDAMPVYKHLTGQWQFELTYRDFSETFKPGNMSSAKNVALYLKRQGCGAGS